MVRIFYFVYSTLEGLEICLASVVGGDYGTLERIKADGKRLVMDKYVLVERMLGDDVEVFLRALNADLVWS